MSLDQPNYLNLCAEVPRTNQSTSLDGLYTYVEINNKPLLFPRESTESSVILDRLNRVLAERKIGLRKEIHLKPWEEICGTLIGLEVDDFKICAILSCTHKDLTIKFIKGSKEAILLEEALNNLLGQRIAILKTDNSQQSILIRSFNASNKAVKTPSQNVSYPRSLER